MRRVLVIGCGGSGKSTFARQLAERTGLPLVHLDQHYWKPGWTPLSESDWSQTLARLLRGERWILDGNYTGSLEQRLTAADTAILLDLPRSLCVWRVLKRRLTFWRVRPDAPQGCREVLRWEFLAWIWNYRRLYRPRVLGKLAAAADEKRILHLTSQREIDAFLRSHPEPSIELN